MDYYGKEMLNLAKMRYHDALEIIEAIDDQEESKKCFDYLLQVILYDVANKDHKLMENEANFLESITLHGDLLEIVNQINGTDFSWHMLTFLNENNYRNMIDYFGRISESITKDFMKKIAKAPQDTLNELANHLGNIAMYLCGLDREVDKEEKERIKEAINLFFFQRIQKQIKALDIELSANDESIDALMAQLNELVGLSRIKEDVYSLVNLLKINQLRKERNLPALNLSNHLVFIGNPGTGKTTVARLLAKIYRQLGLLKKGDLIEVSRADLIGQYVGQTAIKTKEVIQKALGSVLFIDEAYSLNKTDAYSSECIETLLKEMEDHRDELVIIVAGYPDLMEEFLDTNPGLKSRFNKYMYFDDYSYDELCLIYSSMAKQLQYITTEEAYEAIKEEFKHLDRSHNFANARVIRNRLEQIIVKQANRVANQKDIDNETLLTITLEDL